MNNNEYDLSKAVDAETEALYKKYEHLQRIDSHSSVSVRLRRVLAWIADWFCVCLSVIIEVFITVIAEEFLPGIFHSITGLLLILIVILSLCGFAFRDLVFKGRTLGKRIMGLVVIDGETGETPRKGRLALRGLFLMIYFIDGFIMLVTGRTIGDRVSHTYVVPKFTEVSFIDIPREELEARINSYTPAKKGSVMKALLSVIGVIAAFSVITGGITIGVLESVKRTDEYKLAYGYLVDSGILDSVDADEGDVRFTRYSNYLGVTSREQKYTFRFKGHHASVVCHRVSGEWVVCTECTGFGDGLTHAEIYK